MATVFGISALFIALAAMWLSNDALRKINDKNDKFIRTYISSIRGSVEDAIAATQATVNDTAHMKEKLVILEQDITTIKEKLGGVSSDVDSEIMILRSDLATMGSEMTKLTEIISRLEESSRNEIGVPDKA